MLSNSIYYTIKPILPWSFRMWLRRLRAESKRITFRSTWPINPDTGHRPPNWPGWPEGKRFAVVLTHDVEGRKGLSRVPEMMQIEQNLGLRSSFNFVPEGTYSVSDAIRRTLDGAGFEVGIHGLHHDGKLYRSHKEFAVRAARIREYARLWNAAGFRSPFMQHNLGWLHELGLEYDSSTFDTDPFEPQPDAAETIFPFWVPGKGRHGYVELPYTLAQDFLLFVVLRERNIDIWKQKVDWVASHGGMVLVNTHPDYCSFNSKPNRSEFPVQYYEELLSYIKVRYQGDYWHALPREVAGYYRAALRPEQRNTRKKICMVAHSYYDSDNRIRRYAESLADRGDIVDVIGVSPPDNERSKVIKGVGVQYVQSRKRNERNQIDYALRLLRFFVTSLVVLSRLYSRKRYDLVHVHNVPDFLVFAACYAKWSGAKVILDIHDIVPELYESKFHVPSSDARIRMLRWIERASADFSDHVIVSNHLWYERLVERAFPRNKGSVFINHVDRAIFYRQERTRNDSRFIILFPGSFQWHQGLDIAIKALARIADKVPQAELHFYGGGQEKQCLVSLAQGLGVQNRVKFFGGVPLDQMPGIMANADLGVVPKRADSFGNEAYSTKIMEFMSQGVPVVASRTKIDSFYFDDSVIRFFPSGDDSSLASAILDMVGNRALREALANKGYEYVESNSWDIKRLDYFALVDALAIGGSDVPTGQTADDRTADNR